MDYEPVCAHKNTRVEWVKIEEPDEGTNDALGGDCVLFLSGEVYAGKTHCDDCHSTLPDGDKVSQVAFRDILMDKSNKELGIKQHGSQATVRHQKA